MKLSVPGGGLKNIKLAGLGAGFNYEPITLMGAALVRREQGFKGRTHVHRAIKRNWKLMFYDLPMQPTGRHQKDTFPPGCACADEIKPARLFTDHDLHTFLLIVTF